MSVYSAWGTSVLKCTTASGDTTMKVLVLGSGLLGVSSAYYLAQLGHEVTVVDRQASPAAETATAIDTGPALSPLVRSRAGRPEL